MPVVSRRFDAVLFDMDGVLVDSEHRWNDVRAAYAAAHHRPWGPDDQRAVMGANSSQWARIMRDRLELADEPVDRLQDEIVAGVVDRFGRGEVEVMPGATDAVRRIAAGWPIAIASSSHRSIIEAAVDLLGLHGVFGAVVSSDEVAHGKPEPDVYQLAASRLGVAAERCLVVEDSTNGVLAGKAAGAYVVLIPNPTILPAPEAYEAADAIVERLADLDPDELPA
ncbi:MAG TPA: HAD family phosphatase [Candidatus Limnocylindrales bacterium]